MVIERLRHGLDPQNAVEGIERGPVRPHDFAQLAANAIAIHGAGEGLAAYDESHAAGNTRRGHCHELQVTALDAAATAKYRVECALAG